MKLQLRRALALCLPVLLIVAACEVITPEEARETLETTREIKQIQEEEIRPRLTELDDLETKMEPFEQELHDLESQMRSTYMDKIQPLEEQMRGFGPDDDGMRALEQEFEERMTAIWDEGRQLEEEMRQLELQWCDSEEALRDEQDTTLRTKEDDLYNLHRQREELERSARDAIEGLYRSIEDLHRRLGELDPESPDGEALRQEIESLQATAQQQEADMKARLDVLRLDIRTREDELHELHRGSQDGFQALQDEWQLIMQESEQRRYDLEERRRTIEDEMHEQMMAARTAIEDQHRAVDEEMDRIFDEEIVPLEARMAEVELELDGLRQQERVLRQELRTVKSEIGPMEQQLEDRLLDLLENALVTVADEAEPAAP